MVKALTTGFLGTLCVLMASPALRAAEAKAPQTYVILVGIDQYADKQIQSRTHAEADAKAFYDLLTSKDNLAVPAEDIKLLLGKADEKRKAEIATHDNVLTRSRCQGQSG